MAGTDKRKQSLYFPEDMLREIQEEATRQDRSLSWVVQQAWRIARTEIMRFPSVNDVIGEPALPDRKEEEQQGRS
ncbi:TIGR04563 family protein [Vulgatibacter sp.]|uniref:TIGR04563 family protein n=1 Tax=Vulgatibacter sp. TaxID=1971226 RepID=UPI00356A32A8